MTATCPSAGDRKTNIATFILPVSSCTAIRLNFLGAFTARRLGAVGTGPTELAVAKSVQACSTVFARRFTNLLGTVLAGVCRFTLAGREFPHSILCALKHVRVLQFQAYINARAVVCPGAVVEGFGAAVGTAVEAAETGLTFALGLVSIEDASTMRYFEFFAA